MPELPEVETVVRDLRPLLTGRTLQVSFVGKQPLRSPWRADWSALIAGSRIKELGRRGKWISIVLDRAGQLIVHLGMTGQFTVASPKVDRESHTHLVFTLDNGHELRFRDIRRFGSIRYFASMQEVEEHLGTRIGPEPWDLDPTVWAASLCRSRRSLKALLLDQSLVAGVGNIYADESLFAARLAPQQLGCSTTRHQAERLLHAIVEVLDQAIAARGSTIRDYVGGSGLKGGFQNHLRVYRRTGEPCGSCGTPIQVTRLAGRSTHWCPNCQKAVRSRANR